MYILIEIQKNGDQAALVPARTYTDRLQAEAAYHTTLAAAAVSSVEVHTALLIDDHGNTVKRDSYEHIEEPTE